MCDFMSWITKRTKEGTKYYYSTDAIIEATWGSRAVNLKYMEDYIGHDAIRSYFGEESLGGCEHESFDKVPPVIAAEINAGNMRKMALTFRKNFINLKYNNKGFLISINGLTKKKTPDIINPKKYNILTFKEGDVVVLGKHGREEWTDEDPICWDEKMEKYIGKLFKIPERIDMDCGGFYYFSVLDRYEWFCGACHLASPEELKTLKWVK